MASPLDHGKPFVTVIVKDGGSDGMGGYYDTEYKDGEKITVLLNLDQSIQARVAEKQGVKNVFTGIVDKRVNLKSGDLIKRVSDKKYFKITSDPGEKTAPDISTMPVKSFAAEEHTPPKDVIIS